MSRGACSRPASGYRVENNGAFVELDHRAGRLHAVGMDFADNLLGRWQLRHELCNGCEKPVLMEWGASQPAGPVFDAPFFDRPDGAFVLQMKGNGLRPFAAVSGGNPSGRRGVSSVCSGDTSAMDLALWRNSRASTKTAVSGAPLSAGLGSIRTETLRKQLFLSGPLGGKMARVRQLRTQFWRGPRNRRHGGRHIRVAGGRMVGGNPGKQYIPGR